MVTKIQISNKGKGKVETNEVRFNLKSISDKNKPTLISAVFRYDSKKLVYSTQHKIALKYWILKTQKPMASYSFYKEVNDDLKKISDTILKIHNETKDSPLSLIEFKKRLDFALGRNEIEPEGPEIDFISYFQTYIEKMEISGNYKHPTIQKFRSVLGFVRDFRNGLIPFDTIDVGFKNAYVQYRYYNDGSKCNSQNTLNKDLECIKNVLKQSYKEKLHANDIFKDDDFSVSRKDTSIFALTELEVDQLDDFNFNDDIQVVVDWFLISCWSALRWSDFTGIKPEHIIIIDGNSFIEKRTYKTNSLVTIPIDKRLYAKLEKYNFSSPEFKNKYFNDTIKVAFEKAGITDVIKMVKNIKGKQVEVDERKCDIVSAHDGRRTWATINYLKGYPIGLLMQVTGHSKEDTFLSYVGATSKQKALRLLDLMNKNVL